jgi:hypothetical protein
MKQDFLEALNKRKANTLAIALNIFNKLQDQNLKSLDLTKVPLLEEGSANKAGEIL